MAGDLKARESHKISPDAERINLVNGFLSGAVAGITCRMVVAPLDVLKIRFQIQAETGGAYTYKNMVNALRSMVASEGPLALWKGNSAGILMGIAYSSVQFGANEALKQRISRGKNRDLSVMAASGTSAALATLFSYPLDLVRTRMAAEPSKYPTLTDNCRSVMSKFGPRGFYFGMAPTMAQIVPYMAIQFTVYERCKTLLEGIRGCDPKALTTPEQMFVGGLAGITAKFATMPLDTIKKRMQIVGQFNTASHGYRNGLHALVSIYGNEGLVGLFRGTMPCLIKAAPSSAVTFAAFEATKRFLQNRQERALVAS